jgi:hypothetical protein
VNFHRDKQRKSIPIKLITPDDEDEDDDSREIEIQS